MSTGRAAMQPCCGLGAETVWQDMAAASKDVAVKAGPVKSYCR